ncbi:MAG: hypothetical protein L6R35_004047 [Caloplaca aegaea]|nr:MAG: hypothetical protein L6R35_004047 [Caloplaca aegaea]
MYGPILSPAWHAIVDITGQLLGSAYLIGSESAHLNDIYDEESKHLEPWTDSPGEVSTYDWRDFLGNPKYQRAYLDFFEDELVLNGYNWKKVLEQYLLQGKEPLINNLISGLGHPLIHLAYAYELSSREIAMEALSMAASSYDHLHKYLDDPSYTKPPPNKTQSPLEILSRLQQDTRFDGLFAHQGSVDLALLFGKHEAEVLEYWNAWRIADPTKEFQASQKAALALLVASHKPGGKKLYDFFIVHILTTSHAVRILLPLLPAKFHVPLVRQWWLLTLVVYILQLRPAIDLSSVTDYNRDGKDWAWVDRQAVAQSKHSLDSHYVKALRAMKTADETWGPEGHFWLNAAVRFAAEFDGWGGFASGASRDAHL